MFFEANRKFSLLILLFLFVILCDIAVCYKSEIEITPSPIEESTTKKSGFFGGLKNFFRGTTTPSPATTPKSNALQPLNGNQDAGAGGMQRPPPLTISNAPLMPLGPRPDTPLTSPWSGNQQQPPYWPQATTFTSTTVRPSPNTPYQGQTFNQQRPNIGQPNLPAGFAPFQSPKHQPSGIDLSYDSSATNGGRPQTGGPSYPGLASQTSTTSTTSTTPKYTNSQTPMNFDLRNSFFIPSTTTQRPQPIKEEYPPLPPPRRISSGSNDNLPMLPTSRSPNSQHSSPSAWQSPISQFVPSTTPAPSSNAVAANNRVSFLPHSPATASISTVRPGFETSGNSLATDNEIQTLTESLYNKENSHLNQIHVNLQGKTRSIDSSDEAPQPLLSVDPQAFETNTISKLRLLFNNYDDDIAVNEYVTPNERKEENDFVDAVMSTNVMRQAMSFLQEKGVVTPDPKTHRDLVKELWFTQYSRGRGKIGSSGFEHVFVNEVKNGTIIGLHNWVYFYDEEKTGHLDYKGYIHQMDIGTKGKILKVRFTHNDLNKPVNTMFVGTSPELELALYTVCFKLRPDRTCSVSLGNNKFSIITYSWRYRGKNLIGAAYPEI